MQQQRNCIAFSRRSKPATALQATAAHAAAHAPSRQARTALRKPSAPTSRSHVTSNAPACSPCSCCPGPLLPPCRSPFLGPASPPLPNCTSTRPSSLRRKPRKGAPQVTVPGGSAAYSACCRAGRVRLQMYSPTAGVVVPSAAGAVSEGTAVSGWPAGGWQGRAAAVQGRRQWQQFQNVRQ